MLGVGGDSDQSLRSGLGEDGVDFSLALVGITAAVLQAPRRELTDLVLEIIAEHLAGDGGLRVQPLIEAETKPIGNGVDDEHATSSSGHWNRIGMACWAATAGSAAGFEAWLEWSKRHASFDPEACAERWEHYGKSPPTQIGAGTHPQGRCLGRLRYRQRHTGIIGAADTLLVLQRKRDELMGTLSLTGRDIPDDGDFAILFDKATGRWTIKGKAAEVRADTQQATIFNYLREQVDPTGPSEIANETGVAHKTVRKILTKLKNKGLAKQAARGLWASPAAETKNSMKMKHER
jgi:hypothetical protein